MAVPLNVIDFVEIDTRFDDTKIWLTTLDSNKLVIPTTCVQDVDHFRSFLSRAIGARNVIFNRECSLGSSADRDLYHKIVQPESED